MKLPREINIIRVSTQKELEQCYHIRREVYMVEQCISEEDEFDGLDDESIHYLALFDGEIAATARIRQTDKGGKLERYCTLKNHRRKGIAEKLVAFTIEEAKDFWPGETLYLNAQVEIKGLYAKLGFVDEGDVFDECGIPHQKMILK